MEVSMKDPREVREQLQKDVAAERRRMIEKTIERHNLDVPDGTVDAMVGVTAGHVPPADAIQEGALKEKGDDDEEGRDGGVRSQPSNARTKRTRRKK